MREELVVIMRLPVSNPWDAPATLVLEPWGEMYSLEPREEVFIELPDSADPSQLELRHENGIVEVWATCPLRAFRSDGSEIGNREWRPAPPSLPSGSGRGFFQDLLRSVRPDP